MKAFAVFVVVLLSLSWVALVSSRRLGISIDNNNNNNGNGPRHGIHHHDDGAQKASSSSGGAQNEAAAPLPPFIYPTHYPLYKQCDPRWGNNLMGGNATICQQGCAMSCLSMALAARNVTIPQSNGTSVGANPGTLNAWLDSNGGYECEDGDCNNLVLTAPEKLAAPGIVKLLGEPYKPDYPELQNLVLNGTSVFAHVRNRTHFVLLTGVTYAFNTSIFAVNDPFFNSTTYSYDDIADVLMYEIILL